MVKVTSCLISVFLFLAVQSSIALADSAPPIPNSEVVILLVGYGGSSEPVAGLEKTVIDEWGRYMAGGKYFKTSQKIRFFPVPRGKFKVWIRTKHCGETVGNFSFGDNVRSTEIKFDAKACGFTSFSFGR
jgi:hypothetical protein